MFSVYHFVSFANILNQGGCLICLRTYIFFLLLSLTVSVPYERRLGPGWETSRTSEGNHTQAAAWRRGLSLDVLDWLSICPDGCCCPGVLVWSSSSSANSLSPPAVIGQVVTPTRVGQTYTYSPGQHNQQDLYDVPPSRPQGVGVSCPTQCVQYNSRDYYDMNC